MSPRKASSHKSASFVERHGLWTPAQERAARGVEAAIKKHKLELIRFSFADQHGVLRGKTVVASEAAKLLRAGVTMTTTLLAKDTSHRTVFPVFTAGGGFDMPEMQGGGDFVMVADPATFRVLPWADKTGWVLCDIYFTNGKPVPFSTRQIARDALGGIAARPVTISSPASKSNFICSRSRTRGSRPPTRPGRASPRTCRWSRRASSI